MVRAAAEREGNNFKGLKDVRTGIGSSRGWNLALAGSCVPNSLECELRRGMIGWLLIDLGMMVRAAAEREGNNFFSASSLLPSLELSDTQVYEP